MVKYLRLSKEETVESQDVASRLYTRFLDLLKEEMTRSDLSPSLKKKAKENFLFLHPLFRCRGLYLLAYGDENQEEGGTLGVCNTTWIGLIPPLSLITGVVDSLGPDDNDAAKIVMVSSLMATFLQHNSPSPLRWAKRASAKTHRKASPKKEDSP